MQQIKRLPLAGGICASVLLSFLPTRADVVHLKDGSQVEGEIHRTDDGWVVTGADGKLLAVAADRVAFIEARPRTTDEAADQALASLRRAVENATDIKQTLARYKAFIDHDPRSPAVDKAHADMQIWQDRLDRGLIRFNDKWVTREEKEALTAKSDVAAGEALRLLRQSRFREVGPLLDQIVGENPQNAAAWFLKGTLLYHQDELAAARKAFESVVAILPDHAPSLNNIAVIYWRQNQPIMAVGFYDRALQAAANRHDILDNAAEALAALPEEYRGAPVTKKLVRHFNEQDAVVQAQMQKQGLFRWGATWVSGAQLEKLKDAEKQMKDKLDALSADFDAVTARIARIDADVASDKQLMVRMEADSVGRDAATGALVRYPLPAGYYDTARDVKGLQDERSARLAQQEKMRAAAKSTLQSLPKARFTGVQKMIGADGAPISAAVLAAALAPTAPPVPLPAPAIAPAVDPAPSISSPAPAGAQTQPADQTAPPLPKHTVVPPSKPSIMDRYP